MVTTFASEMIIHENLRRLGGNLTSIHFIGDLHGDVHCAKHWVETTKLILLPTKTTDELQWIGSENDALVFLGDYVDKGSTSSEVLTFVKSVQENFPNNVVTILGNHDFFQVLDTGLYFDYDEGSLPHPLYHPFYDYSYSFVHPEEYYQSGFLTRRPDNDEILYAMLSALQSVYSNNLESKVMMCAPKSACQPEQLDMFTSVPPFKDNEDLAERSRLRLEQWRREYAQGLLDSGLLGWMTRQPLMAVVGDALVAHGGVSRQVIAYAEQVANQHGISISSALHYLTNVPFREFWEKHIPNMEAANSVKDRIEDESYEFQLMLDIVQHRGYFKEKSGCQEVTEVIRKIGDGVERIVVGHTPRYDAEELCDGLLLASDSSLSRTFRAYGNHYCPLNEEARRKVLVSGDLNQSFGGCEHKPSDVCEGSISRISRPSPSDPWPRNVDLKKSDLIGSNEKGCINEEL